MGIFVGFRSTFETETTFIDRLNGSLAGSVKFSGTPESEMVSPRNALRRVERMAENRSKQRKPAKEIPLQVFSVWGKSSLSVSSKTSLPPLWSKAG